MTQPGTLRRWGRRAGWLLLVGLVVAGCAPSAADTQAATDTSSAADTTSTTSSPPEVVVAAAGDIAGSGPDDTATAQLVADANPQAVLTLGDNAYSSGTLADYQTYYQPTWGTFNAITYPTPGNHDYATADAAGMRQYFGGRWPADYYSFDLGGWHLLSLNSEIDTSAGSAQERWLRQDLAATTQPCVLAYWHSPRFSSGAKHGSDPTVAPLWQALTDADADLVLAGHEHNYERFAKLNPSGQPDPAGMRELVVGTGGYGGRYRFGKALPGSEARIGPGVPGVALLTLGAGSYTWRFVPAAAGSGDDSGSDACHP